MCTAQERSYLIFSTILSIIITVFKWSYHTCSERWESLSTDVGEWNSIRIRTRRWGSDNNKLAADTVYTISNLDAANVSQTQTNVAVPTQDQVAGLPRGQLSGKSDQKHHTNSKWFSLRQHLTWQLQFLKALSTKTSSVAFSQWLCVQCEDKVRKVAGGEELLWSFCPH